MTQYQVLVSVMDQHGEARESNIVRGFDAAYARGLQWYNKYYNEDTTVFELTIRETK